MKLLEPRDTETGGGVHAGTRLLLATFAVLTLLATYQLLVHTDATERYFAWTIHTELSAAFLGGAFAAGFVLSVLALRQDRWSGVRVALVTVSAFSAVVLVATLVHHHRLHLWEGEGGPATRAVAWFWLAVYLVVPFAAMAVVRQQERHRGGAEAVRRPMPGWLTSLLVAEGAVLFVAGVLLFGGGMTVHHEVMPVTGFWPWHLTPLSAEVIGAWLISFGVAAAMVIRERDLSRLLVPAVAYTAFGAFELLIVWRYRSQVTAGDPWLWAYVAVLAAIVATGGYGWWAAVQSRQRRGPEHAAPGPAGTIPDHSLGERL